MTISSCRVVDEINQGMDERNEREVWRLLVATAEDYSAQYFYMAPKFPRKLEFSSRQSVLFCFSGRAWRRRGEEHRSRAVDFDDRVARARKSRSKRKSRGRGTKRPIT